MIGAGMLRMPHVSPLQFLILLHLNKGPNYGYEVLKTLREAFKGVWEPKTGTIYPALRRLEARGLVKTDMMDDKEFYSLTEKGRGFLNKMNERLGLNLDFSERYYKFVIERMPRAMKEKILERLRTPPEIAMWPLIFIGNFLDELDNTIKLEVLESIKGRLMNGLKMVDGTIKELEEGGTS
jgi:DNA-binding PadR family transcriptional regulator